MSDRYQRSLARHTAPGSRILADYCRAGGPRWSRDARWRTRAGDAPVCKQGQKARGNAVIVFALRIDFHRCGALT